MDQGQPDDVFTHPILAQFKEALALKEKFSTLLFLPYEDDIKKKNSEVTTAHRDEAAHVLRCLKVWYDLPSEVFFVAINLMDRFLSKMRARPKHMACISISSFHLACKLVSQHEESTNKSDKFTVPDTKDLVLISQCKCTLGDLARMEDIISNKLACEPGTLPITSLDFLHLFHSLFLLRMEENGHASFYVEHSEINKLPLLLEILACDADTAKFSADLIALCLLCYQFDRRIVLLNLNENEIVEKCSVIWSIVNECKLVCKISDTGFLNCLGLVSDILQVYNNESHVINRQRLVWKLSHRTLRYLRPTDKLTKTLPTIDEQRLLQLPHRFRSGSLSSDESWDSEEDSPSPLDERLNPAEWAVGASHPFPGEIDPVPN